MAGFEPTTSRLLSECSTAKLHRLVTKTSYTLILIMILKALYSEKRLPPVRIELTTLGL